MCRALLGSRAWTFVRNHWPRARAARSELQYLLAQHVSLRSPGCRCSSSHRSAGRAIRAGKALPNPVGNGTGRAAGAQARGEPNRATGGERNQHSFLASVTVKGQTSPLWSPILIRSHFNGGKTHNTLTSFPGCQRGTFCSSSAASCPFLSPEGFCSGQGLAAAGTHTTMRERKADPVPKGRARSPRPGLANLGPLGCLQQHDLPVWKSNRLLRVIRDTGVNRADTCVSAEEDGSRALRFHFWGRSSSELFYGREFTDT